MDAVAIVPIVIDMLNVVPSFKHHYRAYGGYSPAVKDYQEMGIMGWQDTPEYKRLMKFVEPYEFRERFTMPKFLINACGDQFFRRWKLLPRPHRPKAPALRPEHRPLTRWTDAVYSMVAYYNGISTGQFPEYEWAVQRMAVSR